MNRYKNKILSVLLLAFTFFVVHDYVINTSLEDGTYQYSLIQCDFYEVSQSIEQDVSSELHDNIHSMAEILVPSKFFYEARFLNLRPNTNQLASLSSTLSLPNKPPVI